MPLTGGTLTGNIVTSGNVQAGSGSGGGFSVGTDSIIGSNKRLTAADGTTSKAAYGFLSSSNTGLSYTSGNRLNFLSNGAVKAYIQPGSSNPITPVLYVDGRAEVNGVVTWAGGTSANANTAYGWGDHASAGYLTSYTDTNTTYSAGTGVTLTGTTFSLTDTNAKLNLSGGTMTGSIALSQNPVGTTYGNGVSATPTDMISQVVGDNDGWRLYGESPASNDVKVIFEVVDDIETGDTWVFRNKKTYSPWTATEPFKISGEGNVTALGTVTWSGGGSANANTAYTYSQVGHLPLTGGTLTNNLDGTNATFSGNVVASGNSNVFGNTTLGTTTTGALTATNITASSLSLSGTFSATNLAATGSVSGGQFRASYGSVSDPAYTFKNDDDTGMYGVGGSIKFAVNGSSRYTIGATAHTMTGSLSIVSGELQVGTVPQTVIDSSRNLTNIGTISSGAITAPSIRASSGSFYINRSNDGAQAIRVDADGVVIIPNNYFYVSASQGSYFSTAVRFRGTISNDIGTDVTIGDTLNVTEGIKLNGTTVIDASRNISSGAINASGPVSITGNASYVGNFGYSTLVLQDTSGYPGLNFRHGNKNWLVRKHGLNDNLEFNYSSNASGPGTGTYSTVLTIIDSGGLNFHSGNLENVGTISATGGNSTNWNTAYGWGNHASGGYAPISSPQFNGSLTVGTGGTYVAGSIYSDSNWGMILRARQSNPSQVDFLFSDAGNNYIAKFNHGSGIDIVSGGLKIAATTVIDSSRNLTNIGTISSTAINTSSVGTIFSGFAKGASFFEALNAGNTDGTATSPRFYSPASGTAAISAGGAERLRLSSSGANFANGAISSGPITAEGTSGGANLNYASNFAASGAGIQLTLERKTNATGWGGIGADATYCFAAWGGSSGVVQRFAVGQSGNANLIYGGYQINGTTVIDASRNLTNIGTISSGAITAGLTKLTPSGYTSPQGLAALNIGRNGGGETRAIDIYGSWAGGESKSITFNHGSSSTNMVGQINVAYLPSTNTAGSSIRFGRLYHGGDSPTYTMELHSESTTMANLYINSGMVQIGHDSSYSNYGVVGFGGRANGSNRIFGNNGTGDGLYLASATGNHIHFRTNGGNGNTFRFNANGSLEMGSNNTVVIDASRNISAVDVTATGNVSLTGALLVDGTTAVDKSGTNYMIFHDGGGFPALYAGNLSDNRNYYQSNHHRFRSDDASTTFAELSSAGLRIGGSSTPAEKLHVESGNIRADGAFIISGTTVIDASRNLTNIGTIGSSGRHTITGGAAGDILLKMGSATQTQYVDLQMESDSGTGELFKVGSSVTFWGGASSFNVYNSNGLIAFHPSNTANVVKIDSDGLNIGANKTLEMNGTTVIDANRNLTNIGTISSGSITSSGNVVSTGTHNGSQFRASLGTQSAPAYTFKDDDDSGFYGGGNTVYGVTGGQKRLTLNANGVSAHNDLTVLTGNLKFGTTTVIDSSRNLTNIGTISSGSITSTGVTSTGNVLVGESGGAAYNTLSNGNLFFSDTDLGDKLAYSIGLKRLENIGGNFTKLNIDWHTGITLGAAPGYGGIRFFDNSVGYYNSTTKLFSVGEGDSHVRVYNDLKMGSTTVIDASRNLTNIGTITTTGKATIDNAVVADSLHIRGDAESGYAGGSMVGGISLWGSAGQTTSQIMFKPTNAGSPALGNHGFCTDSYNTYFVMDTPNRGWVFRNATTNTNVASISNTGGAAFNNGIKIGTTTVIDASRNLTNIGSISFSGAISNYTPDARMHLGNNGGGAAGIFAGRRLGDGTSLRYGTYWAYDAFWDDDTRTWNSVRNTLGQKRQIEMNYHSSGWNFKYIDPNATQQSNGWADSDWTTAVYISNGGLIDANDTIDARLGFLVNGTTVIHANRNITAGTISSGAITSTGIVEGTGVIAKSGNTSAGYALNQISFGYAGSTSYQHGIKTRHNSGTGAGNAFDFFLWNSGTDAVGDIGSLRVASIETGKGIDIVSGGLQIAGTTVIDSATNGVFNNLRADGGNLIMGDEAYSASAAYVGMKTSYMSGSSEYMIISGTSDGNTYISAKSGQSVYLRGGGNNAGNQLEVNPSTFIKATTSNFYCTGNVTAYYSSDKSLKENIRVIDNPIEKIKQIRGVYFDWTDDYIKKQSGDGQLNIRKDDVGVIAQEVKPVLDEVVATRKDGTLAVKYEKMIALCIEAIKEQQDQIDSLKTIIEEMKNGNY